MNPGSERVLRLIRERIIFNQHGKSAPGPELFSPLQLPMQSNRSSIDPTRREWSLGELLELFDRQFVQNAYLVLLKRDADLEGLNHRLQGLHTAEWSRLELLFRLRYGPEGKQHKVRVSGLLRAFALERLCAVPVVGLIPSYLRALLRLPRMQRDIEELRGLIARQKNDSDDKARAIVDFQNEELAKIIEHLGN